MVNLFFFDLRDGNTDNFNNLQDERYLLWDRKPEKMRIDDFCLVYYRKNNILIKTRIVRDSILPQRENGKWFVEYCRKKYYFVSEGQYPEFLVFEKIAVYSTSGDLTVSKQGGFTILTQEGKTKFKKSKLPKVLEILGIRSIAEIHPLRHGAPTSGETPELLRTKKQIILYGPPGTGKTFTARKLALQLLKDRRRE